MGARSERYASRIAVERHDGAYYDDIYIKAGSRPKVSRGQYIGRAGNSGASSGPHTHVHLKPCDSCDAVPFQFENARGQEVSMDPQANADPAKWIPLKAALLPKQDPGQKREIIKPGPRAAAAIERGQYGAGSFITVELNLSPLRKNWLGFSHRCV